MTTENNLTEVEAGGMRVSIDIQLEHAKAAAAAIDKLHNEYLQKQVPNMQKLVLSFREAFARVRVMPGRPTSSELIKQVMHQYGMTRAQAKIHIRKVDTASAERLQLMEEGDVAVNNVSPIAIAVAGSIYGRR